jgi:diguanylate cyclase (GGDEF) domain
MGLNNRRAFDTDLASQSQDPANVLALIDIDNFKQANDKYGHDKGDTVLKVIADYGMRLRGLESIQLYRYGGEEIAVIFNHVSLAQAKAWLESWQDAVKTRQFREPDLNVTFSGGVCYMEGHTPVEIIKNADRLLYQAKQTGKDRIVMVSDA